MPKVARKNRRLNEIVSQKPLKGKFKKSVHAKRREQFYSKGKGAIGICFRIPRLYRVLRKIGDEEMQIYAKLTGRTIDNDFRLRFYKNFFPPIIGAINDKCNIKGEFMKELMQQTKHKPEGSGYKMTVEKVEFANKWYRTLSNPEK